MMVLNTFLAHSFAQAVMGGILLGLACWQLLARYPPPPPWLIVAGLLVGLLAAKRLLGP